MTIQCQSSYPTARDNLISCLLTPRLLAYRTLRRAGVEAWRFQPESTVIQVYDNRLSGLDTAAFCASKGARLWRPSGVRGRELIHDVPFQTPAVRLGAVMIIIIGTPCMTGRVLRR